MQTSAVYVIRFCTVYVHTRDASLEHKLSFIVPRGYCVPDDLCAQTLHCCSYGLAVKYNAMYRMIYYTIDHDNRRKSRIICVPKLA